MAKPHQRVMQEIHESVVAAAAAVVVQGQVPLGAGTDLPTSSAVPSPSAQAVVPKNAKPGDTFFATGADGQPVQVSVPEGAQPGDSIPVPWAYLPQATVVGVPIARGDSFTLEEGRLEAEPSTQDNTSSGFGLYILGWFTCCFLGPCGSLCWFANWARHYQRPKEERHLYPKEAAVAKLSCFTGLTVLACHIVLIIMLFSWWNRDSNHTYNQLCANMYQQPQCMRTPRPDLPMGVQFLVYCPKECGPVKCYEGYVDGSSGVYAQDSLICGAALQSGDVLEGHGGVVLVTSLDGQFFIQAVEIIDQNFTNQTWDNSSDSVHTIAHNITHATSTSTTTSLATSTILPAVTAALSTTTTTAAETTLTTTSMAEASSTTTNSA
mmetsp:Transcript_98812/g.265429  ORF Transcript_98812/g.265429 Transcript_98812/m.265429 type:complete len:379 (+) Transcript_98812:90-1226(+)